MTVCGLRIENSPQFHLRFDDCERVRAKIQKAHAGKADSNTLYALDNALSIVKEFATAKFDESIDVAVQLGVDAKKSDQVVRGAVVMPNGTGKTKRVAVFAQGAKAEEAKAAGADIVGMDDLAASIKAGNMDFDVVIASPDTMRIVGTLGQVLGPRGLMPNPKVGTVTPDVATAVKNAKAGQVQFRADKAGIIHATIGRRSFEADKLQGNLVALIDALNKAKPATSKGVYLRKVAVSSTMGLGVRVDTQTISTQRTSVNRPMSSTAPSSEPPPLLRRSITTPSTPSVRSSRSSLATSAVAERASGSPRRLASKSR